MRLGDYEGRFKTVRVVRDGFGVLTVTMHSDGRALRWGPRPHTELPELFSAIGSDRDNRAVILTGTGDAFIDMPPEGFEGLSRGEITVSSWDRTIWDGNRLVNGHLDIGVPMIAAVNGPVRVHSELALLCDVVLARHDTVFADAAHVPSGLVPGDSMQVIWPMLLGPNRGRYFLLTGQELSAADALGLGVVGEVLGGAELLPRARELAHTIATRNPIMMRNTRQIFTKALKRAMADDLHTGLALEALASLSGAEWIAGHQPEVD
jgi:enoyl-CoA hydratase/carnithine racemase